MQRVPAAAIIHRLLDQRDVVVCGLGSTGFAWSEQHAANLTYWASDPMGIWPSFALGLALAQPGRRVVFLEGDGDLAMNLHVLLTLADVAPPNLKIALFNNRAYASAGGNRLAAAHLADVAAICRGAGIANVAGARDEGQLEDAFRRLLAAPHMGIVVLDLEEEEPADSPQGAWAQAEDRAMFMNALLDDQPFR